MLRISTLSKIKLKHTHMTKSLLLTLSLALGMPGSAATCRVECGDGTQQAAAADCGPAPMEYSALAEQHPGCAWRTYPRWSLLTPRQVGVDVQYMLQECRRRLDAVCRVAPGQESFENVFLAYHDIHYNLNVMEDLLINLSGNMDSPEVRAVVDEMQPKLSAFEADITSSGRLWAVVKRAAAQPWVQRLSPARKRYVQQVLEAFRDNGADLPPEQKARKAQLVERITRLQLRFAKLMQDSKNAWQLVVTDKAQLAGMSDDWMQRAAQAAQGKGFGTPENPQWLVTLEPGSADAVLDNCSVPETRRKAWEGTVSQGCGQYDTAPLVAELMQLRHELAVLLGFKNYADSVTARRMGESGDKALAFVDGLVSECMPAFRGEMEEVRGWLQKHTGTRPDKFNPWDIPYALKQIQKEHHDFDEDSLRPYFELEQVRFGMFAIASRLYGISFREIPTVCVKAGGQAPAEAAEVWHPQVRLFAVLDTATGAHLGSFYLDLFPRAAKRSGAWVNTIAFGIPAAGGKPHRPHLAVLSANVTPAAGGRPALLSHRDVTTLFHEFGHMMHCMLSDCELQMQSGTNVDHDFVELPSKLNENWAWEPESLALFARHYKTGQPLPQDLLQKRLATRFIFPASNLLHSLRRAKLDLELHINYNQKFKGRSLDNAADAVLAGMDWPLSVPEPSALRRFSHVMSGGYAAGYYSYKWAESLAADAFTRFKEEGVLNPATGADYRATILSKGDSAEPARLFRDFLHRAPNPDALLRAQGIVK